MRTIEDGLATQQDLKILGEQLDLHHSIIGKIEHGDRRLDVIEYVQYCNAIGANPNEGLKIIQANLLLSAKMINKSNAP